VSVSLNPPLAAQSETVTATLTGLSAPGAHVTVAGLKASVQSAVANTVVFRVPTNVSGGPQTVLIRTNDGTARASLGVLGKVSRNEVLVLVRAGVNQDVFEQRIESLGLGLTLVDFRALSGNGPCGGAIARVGVPTGSALGAVLARLAQPDNQDLILQSDPQSLWGLDASSSPLTAMGVPTARSVRNRTGAGVTIAVLDTGVLSSHSQISGRVLPGYDFVDRDANPGDTFDDPTTGQSMDGHGTPAAVLAAGVAFGVANQASILPVRVGDVNGEVRSDRVLEGLCYALKTVNPQKLVLNLSFGGDTPVEAHRVILEYAIGQGAVVVAAAGNQGAGGPTHYPAAHNLNGLIAVGALKFDLPSMNWIPADFSTHGAYVDIVAPGEGLTSGNALGSFQQYTGTSFSAPLVAGAVALWRQANPAWTPAQIEQGIKDNALALPFPAPSVGAGMVSVAVKP
jgi:subtilisin